MFLAACMGRGAELFAGEDEVVIADFDDAKTLGLQGNPDNGVPPSCSFSSENPKNGAGCVKLSYQNPKHTWGNLQMPVWLCGAEEAVVLWVRRESAPKGAALYPYFLEEDGDLWRGPAIKLDEPGDGWRRASVKLADFIFEGRGDGRKDIASADRMLIGGGPVDFVVCVDDIALAGPDLAAKRREAMTKGASFSVEVDTKAVACAKFMGFGVEWDSYYWQEMPEEHWKLVLERIRWMKLPIVRTMIVPKWCYRGDGKFDWESVEMRRLTRHLDAAQKQGITVILTDWGCASKSAEVNTWMKTPGLKGTDDPEYAEVIGTYLDYLINKKGYSCVRYFILVNEPNWVAEGWDAWKKGVQNVAAVLKKRKLDAAVTLVGSDYCQDADDWHRRAVDQLASVLGAYDLHRYARDIEVRNGDLETYVRKQWDYARAKDPQAREKPFIIAESGRVDGGFSASANQSIGTYTYGVFIADYAAQAARAGSSAMLVWMLDDSSHKDFGWGLWSDTKKGLKLRPWFYTWSLFCRYFPAGSTIYRVEQPGSRVRVLAAQAPKVGGPNEGGWTFCIVNRGRRSVTARLAVPGGKRAKFKQYLYSEQSAKADADGFPIPVAEPDGDLGKGVEVICPADAVVFLTSVQR